MSDSHQNAIAAVTRAGAFYKVNETVSFVGSSGEPVSVGSKAFTGIVARLTKLSPRKTEFKEALAAILDYAHQNAIPAQATLLTGCGRNGELLVHLGNGVILKTNGGNYVQVPNGSDGIIFEHERSFQGITVEQIRTIPIIDAEQFPVFRRVILRRLPPPTGLLTRDELEALVLAMWVSIFVRPWAPSRPIFFFIGPPGSGKTVTQRLFATALYGPRGQTGGGTALDRVPKDICAVAAHRSLIVRDDVNDMPEGGVDVLCRIATGSDFEVSVFHETLELGVYQGRGLLVLSAFSPSWLEREDLMSRFITLELAKASFSGLTERQRVQDVLDARPAIWRETLQALKVLAGRLPERRPTTRFDDWEKAIFPVLEGAGYGATRPGPCRA